MKRLLISNVRSVSKADIVIIGLPDESKSDSYRSGAKNGPDVLRSTYNESLYFDGDAPGKKIPIAPMSGFIDKRIFDFGNVSRKNMYSSVFSICSKSKIPIILGGDHSLTTIALRAIKDLLGKKISLLYFDAHPDFLSTIKDFHGSVLSDSADCIDFRRSMLIGIRASEPEELQNINKNGLEFFTPFDIVEKGITTVTKRLLSKCTSSSYVYLSIDLDCVDSGIAPGVSVPSACGLMPMELIYFIKKICSNLRIVGLDIVELSPKYDLNNNTANIGARLLMEAIASLSIPKRK